MDELMKLIAEADRPKAKELIAGLTAGLVRLPTTPEGFTELIKSNPIFASWHDGELSRRNAITVKRYEDEVVPQKVAELRKKIESELHPETDPEKIKGLIDLETDESKKVILSLRYENAIQSQKMKSLEAGENARQELERKNMTRIKIKGIIETEKYDLDPDDFVAFGETAEAIVRKFGEKQKKDRAELEAARNAVTNGPPRTGLSVITSAHEKAAEKMKARDYTGALSVIDEAHKPKR